MGDDDLDCQQREDDPQRGHRSTGPEAPPRERVPDAHARDHERDLLLRQRGRNGTEGEGHEAVLVEVPKSKEQERTGERDGVELVEGQPFHRRVEEVGKREAERRPRRTEVLPCEPEHGQRAERDRNRLCHQEHGRARPQPPERREEDEDRVDV